jgi:hypothetical protein
VARKRRQKEISVQGDNGMKDIRRHLDTPSLVVVAVTLALFVAALFVKGIGHDLLLEAGVFLVSVKLIIMAYKSSVASAILLARLEDMHATLERLEVSLASQPSVRPGHPAETLPQSNKG